MPQVTELRTPPATQGAVVSLWAQGTPKRKIARELGIDKNTVASILKAYGQDKSESVSRVNQLIPIAYDALEKGLKAGKAELGLRFLEATVLGQPTEHLHLHGDVSLTSATTMVPSTASTPGTPSLPSTVGGPTEAAKNPTLAEICLSVHAEFFQEISKQPPKQPITLTCGGQTLQVMRLASGGEPAPLEGVIEVSPLPSSPEQGDKEK